MWCAFLQCFKNGVADASRISTQMRILEGQRHDAARLQKLFSFLVVLSLVWKSILAAVQLHVQFCLLAKEIQAVIAKRVLAPEFKTAETTIAQPASHELLRPGFPFAQLTGAFDSGQEARL